MNLASALRVVLTVTLSLAIACAQTAVDLRPKVPPTVQVPLQKVETIDLSVTQPPVDQTVMTYILKAQPIPGSAIIVVYHSSQYGADKTVLGTADPAQTPDQQRTLNITLPTFRPFTAEDVIEVLYWTQP